MSIVKLIFLLDGLVSLLDVLEGLLYLGEVAACAWSDRLGVYSLLDCTGEGFFLFI
jgi:hypothetical protein